MTPVTLSIGSNQDAPQFIRRALDALHIAFGSLVVSSVYESEPVGMAGCNFLNLALLLHTEESLAAVSAFLKQLEIDNGRVHDGERFSPRTLDIDILTYGSLRGLQAGIMLPRPEITHHAFVLLPLSEVAPQMLDPESGLSYRVLWEQFSDSAQVLWPVDFVWQGRRLSRAFTRDERPVPA
jgi:2-amino-4-hydroxy-6-hydroxymethyldihydropteridine diphosphokinase